MGILDNQKFALMICDMFYNQEKTQKEIAAEMNISRPQVCRILANARATGLVNIHLSYPNPEENIYEQKLRELYGLSEVFVYDIGSDNQPMALDLLAQKSSNLFNAYIKDNSRIGVMSGRSVLALSKAFPAAKLHGTEFVPLCGGSNFTGCEWFANSNARLCAEKTSSRYYILNAPSTLSSVEAKAMLCRESSIEHIIDLWGKCDTVLLGIGTVGLATSTSVAGSYLQKEIETLRELGAVSSVCCSYLDASGREIHHELTERFIGASVSQIAQAKKIAVAIGAEKTIAIHTALISDSVDVLITSLETAKRLADE